ncbi:MAG: hypothetical protein K9K64_09785 [Desulfohalobiaceae bacterium]|nr:hypothetical protein [Desulfohalobiaceae bacterium]
MKKQHLTKTMVTVLILLMASPVTLGAKSLINCSIQEGACTQKIRDGYVQLDIQPKPVKAMQDLLFRVSLQEPGRLDGPPFIDLGMPGMKMGPNRVRLEKAGPGLFEGRGVIVRCPSGKTVWRAEVRLPGLGTAEFVFDVVY